MKKTKKMPITNDTVKDAYATLQKYKAGKANLEERIISDEQWWRLRHYEGDDSDTSPTPWLFNSIINKHADAMDNLPEVSFLPREPGDVEAASLMSECVPLILEQNNFERTYSDCWYDKLKNGTACYGVFWNKNLDSGFGNVDIRRIDILNLFWEPGINDLQSSKNIFHVELWDNEVLRNTFPSLSDSLSTPVFDSAEYVYDDTVDTSDKSCVIDWYYKKQEGSKTVLHYAKFCNGILLYASENDESFADMGFYNHGKYPFFMDKMFPIQGSPCGFGIVDAMRGTQAQIDSLSDAIVKNAQMASRRRFFVRADGSINEREFADWKKPFVHYNGSGDPRGSVMPIELPYLSDVYVSILNRKVDELKETSGNRDFSQGTVTGGVTAAAAIEALQEAGSKTSRDVLSATYKVFEEISALVISLIKQFYIVPRCFRITGNEGKSSFKYCTRDIFSDSYGEPVFDIKVRAHKKSAFSRASLNELAMKLYELGMFSPENAPMAKACLEIMEFEGKDEVLRKLSQGEYIL